MFEDMTFRILIVALMGINFAISGHYRSKADKEGGQLDPKGNRVLLFLRLATLLVLIPFFTYMIYPKWASWARFDAPEAVRWFGAGLTLCMSPMIYWLFSTIGNNISPSHTTRESHQLITTGPYRFIRHPLYTFGMLAWMGVGLMALMWWIFAALFIMCTILAWRTRKEEQQLIDQFGQAYRDYMARTGRYFPKVSA